MPLAGACAAAQAAITHARSLFGPDALPQTGASDAATTLRQAREQTADLPAQMQSTSGALTDAHSSFANRAAARLGAAASADSSLDGYLTQAAGVSQAGASRLDAIAAQNRATVLAAASARTPAAQRAVLSQLHSQVAQARDVVNSTRHQGAGLAAGIRGLSYGEGPPLSPPTDGSSLPQTPPTVDQRRRNQIDAFKKMFGRDPSSASDWDTAAALDPHSYDPKNAGVPPKIVVGRIKPVPGQGVVRTNLFIPGEKAWTPLGGNLGDNRGFDPNAGPEESRVTIYTDYDNGIVVARQNLSVLQAPWGTEVQAGDPDVQVSQNPNGSVLIRYHAADPFSPGGQDLAKATPWNVNGSFVVKPTPTGPIVGGSVSDFPAVEIYNDNAGHTVDLGKIMPQNTSQFGPLAGLPFEQNIGPPLMGEFPDTIVPGSPPLPAPLPGGPHLPPVAPLRPPIVIPYPSVQLGPVESAPRVPIGH
jgi:hypothetical protein